ncbi:MAG: lipoprotein [Myxococcota bacterium]
MKRLLRVLMVVALAFAVGACGPDDEDNNSENNGTADAGDVMMDADEDAGDTETDGDTSEETQSIVASDQTADPLDEVTVDEVYSDGAGWVVIHEADADAPGAVIGNAAVTDGMSTDVTVTLGRDIEDGETLYAMLHVDDPEDGQYNFDGSAEDPEDPPAVDADGNVVIDSFVVSAPGAQEPSVTVSDQTADPANEVVVEEAVSEGAGWIVIHEQNEAGDAIAGVIGHAALTDGINTDVTVTLDRDVEDGETLYAMLHTDDPADGDYTFDGTAENPEDPPVESNGEVVVESFVVSTPSNEPTVTPTDQTLELSTMVTIDSANLLDDGFIVIHEQNEAGDAPAGVIGHSEAISAGEVTDVTVALTRPADDGETLYAMLHDDTGTAGEYEFDGTSGSEDPPTTDSNDDVVVVPFEVTVPADTPAVRFTLSNNGNTSYDVTGAEPALYEDWIGTEAANQTITLNEGWRYEIVNNATVGNHPFELINSTSPLPVTDTVLASQRSGEEGTLETDTDVNWVQNGDDVTFTLTANLAAELNGYRCGTHTTAMRGDVTTQTP